MDPITTNFLAVLSLLFVMTLSSAYRFAGLQYEQKYFDGLAMQALNGLDHLSQTVDGLTFRTLQGLYELRQAENKAAREVIASLTEDDTERERRPW